MPKGYRAGGLSGGAVSQLAFLEHEKADTATAQLTGGREVGGC